MQEALPRTNAIRAAIRLLADDDRFVIDSCRGQLLSWGPLAHEELRRAASSEADAQVRAGARSVLRSMSFDRWAEDFTALAEGWRWPGADVDLLADGVCRLLHLLVGRFEEDHRSLMAAFDAYGARLMPLVAGRTSTTAARHLGAFLSRSMGLRGGGNLAPDRRHVRLDRVLSSGPGTSAMLAAVALIVGRRAGLELTAVRLPEFFLVRVHGRRRVLVDPYHDGRTVTRSDCLRYLRSRVVGVPPSTFLAGVDDATVLMGVVEDVIAAHDGRHEAELRRVLRRASRALGRTARPLRS